MKVIFGLLITLLLFTPVSNAQEVYTPLATMTGRDFTVKDLPSDVGNAWHQMPATMLRARKDLLELQIDNLLLLQEANKRSISVEDLIEAEVNKKVPDPDENSIKTLYEQNKASIGDTPLSELRPQLINYLRLEPEQKARESYSKSLRAAAAIEYVKDVNSEKFSLNDVLAKVNGEPVTFAMYKRKNGLALYEYEANVFDRMDASLHMVVNAAVYQAESQEAGIPVNQLIAKEITSKMKDFSADEQKRLEGNYLDRLYAKYRVKYFVSEPKPFVQKVSADDDPVYGDKASKVTIVVFADYECPACAGVHPVIKELVDKYGKNVKLVYRDFPLQKVHKNALAAARAAFAAAKQNKFFEYSEMLYENQIDLEDEALITYAKRLGLDTVKFTADFKSEESLSEVNNDMADGIEYGVTGTPSIFVNGYKIRALSMQAFEKAIERAIGETR